MAADRIAIGLTSAGTPIEATAPAGDGPTVLVIGGLDGTLLAPVRPVRGRLLTIPLANPTKTRLVFPPVGTAYKENGESHYLWRWIGTTTRPGRDLRRQHFGLGARGQRRRRHRTHSRAPGYAQGGRKIRPPSTSR
jgi:hypothetical protein